MCLRRLCKTVLRSSPDRTQKIEFVRGRACAILAEFLGGGFRAFVCTDFAQFSNKCWTFQRDEALRTKHVSSLEFSTFRHRVSGLMRLEILVGLLLANHAGRPPVEPHERNHKAGFHKQADAQNREEDGFPELPMESKKGHINA